MDVNDQDTGHGMTRRGLLGAGSLLGAGGLAAANMLRSNPAMAQAMPKGAPPQLTTSATVINSEFKQIAPNVYAFIQREAKGQSNLSVSNCGVVVGPRSMLAIDTTGGPQHARNFIAAARPLGKPFDRVVITHEHPDHIVGLPQFPGIDVVCQEETRVQMLKQVGAARPGYWNNNPAWAVDSDRYEIVIPNVTFKDKMSVYYGDTQVDFIFPGRAHTSGDTLVMLPREKILFMGDIAFYGVTPLNGSGFISDWIKVCDRIMADPGVQTIVPGHGPIGGKAELADMKGYLELLLREGKKRHDAGMSAGRAAAEIDLGHYATWTDPQRIVNNVVRLYSELNGSITADTDRAAVTAAITEYNAIRAKG